MTEILETLRDRLRRELGCASAWANIKAKPTTNKSLLVFFLLLYYPFKQAVLIKRPKNELRSNISKIMGEKKPRLSKLSTHVICLESNELLLPGCC